MVLELQVARVTGRLRGEDEHDRFDGFLTDLAEEAALATFLEEYPVLARQVQVRTHRWVATVAELAHGRRPTASARHGVNGGDDPGPLVGLRLGAGDRHRQGRSVAMPTFASGLEVAYKPRPSAADVHFQELRGSTTAATTRVPHADCSWIAVATGGRRSSSAGTAPPTPRSNAFTSGWVASSRAWTCWPRHDLHDENLVAEGEHPVVIDLEC